MADGAVKEWFHSYNCNCNTANISCKTGYFCFVFFLFLGIYVNITQYLLWKNIFSNNLLSLDLNKHDRLIMVTWFYFIYCLICGSTFLFQLRAGGTFGCLVLIKVNTKAIKRMEKGFSSYVLKDTDRKLNLEASCCIEGLS